MRGIVISVLLLAVWWHSKLLIYDIAMVFKGLSIHIPSFIAKVGLEGGAYSRTKIPVQELCLKVGGELIRERGHIPGTLR